MDVDTDFLAKPGLDRSGRVLALRTKGLVPGLPNMLQIRCI